VKMANLSIERKLATLATFETRFVTSSSLDRLEDVQDVQLSHYRGYGHLHILAELRFKLQTITGAKSGIDENSQRAMETGSKRES